MVSVFEEEVPSKLGRIQVAACLAKDSHQRALVQIVVRGDDERLFRAAWACAAQLQMAATPAANGKSEGLENGQDVTPESG